MTRRFLVFDGDGELVATFPEWETAHGWAHMRSVEPLTPQPVQVEDREKRQTWTIESGRCRLTVWRRHVEYGHCVSGGPVSGSSVSVASVSGGPVSGASEPAPAREPALAR